MTSNATQDASGFAVGTLVHTRDGTRPIETLSVGDEVLAKSEKGGAREYRRIVRVVRHESRAIGRAHFWTPGTKGVGAEDLLATANRRVYVCAYRNDGGFSDEYFEEIDKPIGWRRVDWLESHQVVQTADGDEARVGMFDRIWMTRDPQRGWIEANPDSTTGHMVQISNGHATPDAVRGADADFAGVDDFNERNETPELQETWGYKCDVYDLEVEEFHTYYVGERGVWVHDATSVAP